MEISTKKVKREKYTNEHKLLFIAIFQGTNDIDKDGNIVVGEKVWEYNDHTVQLFIRKARQLKTEMTKMVEKEMKYLFGK